MASSFGTILREMLQDGPNSGRGSKKKVAEAARMHPTTLAKLLSDDRRPGSRLIVLDLLLALDQPGRADELLLAAEFAPLSDPERKTLFGAITKAKASASRVTESLTAIEADVYRRMIESDLRVVSDSLEAYADLRRELIHRQWESAAKRARGSVAKSADQLHRVTARILAHQYIVLSNAELHLGNLTPALNAAIAACNAASGDNNDRITTALAQVQLADTHRAMTDYTAADEVYEQAEMSLTEWPCAAKSDGAWRDHNLARVYRKRAVLYLQQGNWQTSAGFTSRALRTFEEHGNQYERARTLEVVCWQQCLAGNATESLKTARQLDECINQSEQLRSDPKLVFDADLAAASALLATADYTAAEERLRRAEACATSGRISRHYHEIGRMHVMIGRLNRQLAQQKSGDPGRSDMCREALMKALRFYSGPERSGIQNKNSAARWSDPSRLAYVHINIGKLEMTTGNPKAAIEHFGLAYTESQKISPPNAYYASAAMAHQALARAETCSSHEEFQAFAQAARQTCGKNQNRHLARVEVAAAAAAIRWHHVELAAAAARTAISTAARFNKQEAVWTASEIGRIARRRWRPREAESLEESMQSITDGL